MTAKSLRSYIHLLGNEIDNDGHLYLDFFSLIFRIAAAMMMMMKELNNKVFKKHQWSVEYGVHALISLCAHITYVT